MLWLLTIFWGNDSEIFLLAEMLFILYLQPSLEALFTVLALCHTVRVDRKDNLATGEYSNTGFEYEYQASSPDEKALVEACRR